MFGQKRPSTVLTMMSSCQYIDNDVDVRIPLSELTTVNDAS
jgi:hypothetical protein